MDFNPYSSSYFANNDTITSWEFGMAATEDHYQVLHHHHQLQLPFDSLWPPAYSLQIHHQPSSSMPPQLPINKPAACGFFVSHEMENHQHPEDGEDEEEEEEDDDAEEVGGMKEMMYQIAAMQPVDIDPATIQRPKRRNVRISDDPQSVAARLRRERISQKMRILQRLVPGGTKMDTSTMLDEAIRYVKFLKRQIRQLQSNPQCPHLTAADCLLAPSKAAIIEEPPSAPVYGFRCGGDAHPLCLNHGDEVISCGYSWDLFE